nr:ATP-binding protein [Calditrichia bacterium]
MPLGVMAWVRGDLIDVYQTVGPWEQMPVGNSLTLKDSYTELAIQAGGMIAIENVGQSPYASSGAYQKLGLESIIFKTLEFNGTVYGTLGFIDLNPHEHPFNEFEKDFIRLMGEWVSFVIRQEELEILQKKQTEDLARSNRELQQFAYVASHDLQEPLRMITSYSQLFAKRYQDQLDEKADRYITYIIEGGARMKNLLDTLLKYSRLGNMERNEARFDGKKMVETALTNLAVLIQESRAGIRIGDIPEIWGDESQLTLVIQNLVANAIKFVRDKTPNVQIEAEVSGKYWCFSVRDNGIGIAPEHRKRVFEVF